MRRPSCSACLALVAASLGCILGCPEETGPETGASLPLPPAAVVVGVTSDLRVGVDIDRIHVLGDVGGQVVRDDDLPSPLELPAEVTFGDLEGGERVSVELEAYSDAIEEPLVRRLASTTAVAHQKLLLRAALDADCASAGPGGGVPSCNEPETCIGGVCEDSYRAPSQLESYTLDWYEGVPDICKPAGAGEPVVIVGEGQADYLPMDDYDLAQVEAGPQGGHHVWVAIRMKNLKRSGSVTSVTGRIDELGLDIGPFNVIFTFDPDEGGYCKLYGLRFQIDAQAPIENVLGHTMKITVEVRDPEGGIGTGSRIVKLSQTTI